MNNTSLLKTTGLTFNFKAIDEIYTHKFPGVTLRGAFGYSLRRAMCLNKSAECDECILEKQCSYRYIFDSPSINGEQFSTINFAPHPFAIKVFPFKNHLKTQEEFSFDITLFGKGVEYLPHFILAWNKIGEIGLGKNRGKFSLISVYNNGNKIYGGESIDGVTISEYKIDENISGDGQQINIRVDFLSPTVISKDGRVLTKIDFETLIHTSIRRLKLLSYFHDNPINIKYNFSGSERIRESNLNTFSLERYSTRKKSHQRFDGVNGYIVYENVDEAYYRLLKSVEAVSLGKKTSFGFGQIKVSRYIM